MGKELEEMLYTYLGELMHRMDTTFDWVENDSIRRKMNAVYVLLGIEKHEESTMSKIINLIKADK